MIFRLLKTLSPAFFLILFMCTGNSFSAEWVKSYDTGDVDEPRVLKATPDGGYVLASSVFGEAKTIIIKLDSNGNIQWKKTYNGQGYPESFEIKAIENIPQGYILAGSASTCYENEGALCRNFGWLAKIDLDGNILWQRGYEVEGPTSFHSVTPTSDGGFIAVGFGRALGTVTAHKKPLVMKMDSNGDVLWRRLIDTQDKTLGYDSEITAVLEANSSTYLIGGHISSGCSDEFNATGGSDILIAIISDDGSVQWVKVYDFIYPYESEGNIQYFSGHDMLSSAKKTGDGFILAGMTGPWGYADGFLMKIDASGNILWQKKYDEGISSGFNVVTPVQDGSFLVGGLYQGGSVVLKTNSQGDIIWKNVYAKTNKVISIEETSNSNFIALTSSNHDLTVIKADKEGKCCIFEREAEVSVSDASFVSGGPTLYFYPYYDTSDISIKITKASAMDTSITSYDICPKTLSITLNGKGMVDINYSLFGEAKSIRCTDNCNVKVDFMSDVSFYTYPYDWVVADGYAFHNWSGDCEGYNVSIKMDKDKVCYANFLPEKDFIFLNEKWNFISFPKLPEDKSIASIMAGKDVRIIWGYDNEKKRWLKWRPDAQNNNLNSFEFGKGYWIYMNAPCILYMNEWILQSQSAVSLFPGWNLIGWLGEDDKPVDTSLISISDDGMIVWGWSEGTWSVNSKTPISNYPLLQTFQSKRAYWLKTNKQTTWQQGEN